MKYEIYSNESQIGNITTLLKGSINWSNGVVYPYSFGEYPGNGKIIEEDVFDLLSTPDITPDANKVLSFEAIRPIAKRILRDYPTIWW